MNRLKNRVKAVGFGVCIFLIGVIAVYIIMPKEGYRYNNDASLSAVGMMLSKTYLDFPKNVPKDFQGYVQNGEFTYYNNWPPLGFKVLAFWFKLTGDSSTYAARLFSALLYGVNAFLFYILLIKNGLSNQTAFLSSIIFILLPTHLDYSYLIYADIWFVTFWLLALMWYDHTNLKYYWVFSLIAILGIFFYWFVIIILPIPLLVYLIKKYKLKLQTCLFILLGITSLIWIIQTVIFISFPESYLTTKLYGFSMFGLSRDFAYFSVRMIKRIASFGYEVFFLAPLIAYYLSVRSSFKTKEPKWLLTNLHYIWVVMLIALFFYIVTFANWFGAHRHGIAMFSIIIGVTAALIFAELEKLSARRLMIGSGISITMCLVTFLCFPWVTSEFDKIKDQDLAIISFINKKKQDNNYKPNLFFDVPSLVDREPITMKFVICEKTNGYLFNTDAFQTQLSLKQTFRYGSNKLKQNIVADFTPSSFFLITHDEHDFEGLQVIDSMRVNAVKVYQLSLLND